MTQALLLGRGLQGGQCQGGHLLGQALSHAGFWVAGVLLAVGTGSWEALSDGDGSACQVEGCQPSPGGDGLVPRLEPKAPTFLP